MKAKIKLLQFLDSELPGQIIEGICIIFDPERDPEVSWGAFRDGLRKLKKQHKKLYQDYMESDVD